MIEKNHEFIRYVLPKGSSFKNITQEDCNLIMNNINSLCYEKKNIMRSWTNKVFFYGLF